MKQYVIDQLRETDHKLIHEYLQKHGETTSLREIFWISLPEELYSATQKEHKACHPYYFAVNLSWTQAAFEFLIRSRQIMRCACIGYASREQRDHIMGFADDMLETLGIKV